MQDEYKNPIILIVAPGFISHMEEMLEISKAAIAANYSHPMQIIEPHQKPSKMYSGLTPHISDISTEMRYFEPIAEKAETPTIPLPTSYRINKNKYLPTVNTEKSEATRLKNRKKRKAKRNR